jgi:membrane fusion protein
VTDGPVRDKQGEVLIQEQAVAEIEQQILSQKAKVSQAERSLEIVRAETRVTEQAAERGALDMREQLARTAVGQRQVVTAPTDALVGTVSIQAGQSVRPGMAAVSLVPNSAKLVAELFLPVSSEGEIQVGQRLYVQFDSTSKVRSPKFDGRIVQVDAVPSEPAGEGRAAGKGDSRVVRFLVELDASAESIRESGVPLRAGLPARAFIPQATHSLLGWAAQMLVKH